MNDQYAALAELAGGFIHEIKNHLSTLGLNLQLLAEDFQDPQSQRERRALSRIQRLQTECQHLVDVSNDFLRFARIKDLTGAKKSLARLAELREASSDPKFAYFKDHLALLVLDARAARGCLGHR